MIKRRFLCLLLALLLTATMAAAGETGYVNGRNADRVHLRKGPSQDSESLGLFYSGAQVELDSAALSQDWVQVGIGAMRGYMMNDYLQTSRPAAYVPVACVKSSTLNLRSQPSKQSKVLRVLEQNEKLAILGQTASEWYYVKCTDGLNGYVMPEYVSLNGESTALDNVEIRKVGETYNGDFIYSWPAPNGQMLYFTALEDPAIKFEDVNFDGHDDVVVFIIRGASNFYTEFFVWDQGQYVYARHPGLSYAVCNYHLYPEYGIVHSDANNGSAGAEHEDILMRWEGNELRVIRRAVSENNHETNWYADGSGYEEVTDLQNLRVRVWDYPEHAYDGTLVYDELISLEQLQNGGDYARLFAGEQEALWKGIK